MIFNRLIYTFMLMGLIFVAPVAVIQAQTLKIATLSPEGSFWMVKMREGSDKVAEATAKRVQIRYYPGGVMGDDKSVVRKMRIGQLQGGAVVSGSVAAFYPDCQVYGLPFKFQSFEEVDYVRGKMDARIIRGLEDAGLVTFGIAEGGFAYVMSQYPVLKVEDMQKQKVWAPDNDPMILEAAEPFGIRPIPLALGDVRAGLQTGLIDAVTVPPIGAVVFQWHTQLKHLMDYPFLYTYAVLSVDSKAFDKIKPEDQLITRQIMAQVFKEIDQQNRKDNLSSMEALKKQGIQFNQPTPEEKAEWEALGAAAPKRLIQSKRLSADIVNELEAHLAEYRSTQK